MNVRVKSLVKTGINAQLGRTAAHHGHCRLHGLLHHVAKLAGLGEAAFTRHQGGLDAQQFTTHLGPRQAGNLAYLVVLFHHAVAETFHAQVLVQVLAGNRYVLQLAVQGNLLD